jgi:hypothetical protein
MLHVLVDPIATPTGTHPIGKVLDAASAHLLKSTGGVLLPYDPEVGQRRNGVCSLAMRAYDTAYNTAYKSNPMAPSVLPGPIVFVGEVCKAHWALKLRAPRGDQYEGRISMLASTQSGQGMVRIQPLDAGSIDLAHVRGAGDHWWVTGSFYVRPMQTGFTSFDYYIASPEVVEPLWVAITLTRE